MVSFSYKRFVGLYIEKTERRGRGEDGRRGGGEEGRRIRGGGRGVVEETVFNT